MAASIFAGNFVKTLRAALNLRDAAYLLTGTDSPTAVAKNAPKGSLYLRQTASGDGSAFVKLDNGSSTNWLQLGGGGGGDPDYARHFMLMGA